jgi:hypothetical protein
VRTVQLETICFTLKTYQKEEIFGEATNEPLVEFSKYRCGREPSTTNRNPLQLPWRPKKRGRLQIRNLAALLICRKKHRKKSATAGAEVSR